MDSTLVIKVKYGDTLRRFNVHVNENGQLDLDIDGLRSKILGLFNFPLDVDLTLTYVDEDGDVVTLVDDDDLRDVMRQCLKFLRIDVQLNNDKLGKSYSRSSGSSTPRRSPNVQNPLPNLNTGVADVMKSVPEPLRETLSKLSLDLASKASTSSPVLAELIDCVSKMAQPYLIGGHRSQVGADSSVQSGPSELPKPPTMPTVPNASNDGIIPDILLKTKSTGKTSEDRNRENIPSGMDSSDTIVSAPVDLNQVPLFDSNPSGWKTVNFGPAVSSATADEGGKGSKKQNAGLLKEIADSNPSGWKTVNFGPAVSSATADEGGKGSRNQNAGLPRERPAFSGFPALAPTAFHLPPQGIEMLNGVPVANHAFVPPRRLGLFKRSNSRNDAMVGIFHNGVQCDGCGIHPITGPRYKSKVKQDYDLCSICFTQMGNEANYIKMERPAPYRHARSFKGLHDPSQNIWAVPPLPNMTRTCGVRSAQSKLDSRFIVDVNILDGTIMAPCTSFTKIWRMRNSGRVAWPQGAKLVWIGGDRFSHSDAADVEIPASGVPVDGELDIAVDFTSPELPGRYISYWRMASPSGTKFGQRVWVLIQVDASLKDSFGDNNQGLNLNLPPDGSGSKASEIVDTSQLTDGVLEPTGGVLEPPVSSSLSKTVETELDEQAKKDQELNFPINDTLLVGHDVLAPASPKSNSSTLYPIIDLSEAVLTGPSEAFPAMDAADSSKGFDSVNDAVEKDLLKELEEMGFKQVDLNKEILRLNKYDLEQSLDDLCGVDEWDPILEELQEMGFCDEETNRKLLKKNNGSIKRVVMDLLRGEKA